MPLDPKLQGSRDAAEDRAGGASRSCRDGCLLGSLQGLTGADAFIVFL